jgi:hypothetical protein
LSKARFKERKMKQIFSLLLLLEYVYLAEERLFRVDFLNHSPTELNLNLRQILTIRPSKYLKLLFNFKPKISHKGQALEEIE